VGCATSISAVLCTAQSAFHPRKCAAKKGLLATDYHGLNMDKKRMGDLVSKNWSKEQYGTAGLGTLKKK